MNMLSSYFDNDVMLLNGAKFKLGHDVKQLLDFKGADVMLLASVTSLDVTGFQDKYTDFPASRKATENYNHSMERARVV